MQGQSLLLSQFIFHLKHNFIKTFALIHTMNNKKLSYIIISLGILLILFVFIIKFQNDKIVEEVINEQGSCFLEDGTCLHKQNSIAYTFSWILGSGLIALGIYLGFFEKSQKEILSTLENQKQINIEKEKWNILMMGLSDEEQKVINAVKEQDGITQQTLRLRTDMHKSKLSIILSEMEEKGLVIRKEKGKTKQVFIKIHL